MVLVSLVMTTADDGYARAKLKYFFFVVLTLFLCSSHSFALYSIPSAFRMYIFYAAPRAIGWLHGCVAAWLRGCLVALAPAPTR